MPDNTRFLLGFGERLTERVAPPGGGGGSEPAYTFDDAVTRLQPMLSTATTAVSALPSLACPDDEAIEVVTLHPQWMAKSYHPQALLNEYNLRQVGSRPVLVEPEKWTRASEPTASPSTELYVAGKRDSFRQWEQDLEERPHRVSDQIRRLEEVRAPVTSDRVRNVPDQLEGEDRTLFEVVLHASDDPAEQFIIAGFEAFAQSLGAQPSLDRRVHAGGLCFMPVDASPLLLRDLVQFAFVRVARPMPRLRSITPIERSVPAPTSKPSPLPTEDAVDPDLRIAVFDGGLDATTPLSRWATGHDTPGVAEAVPSLMSHGHDVTSSVLFGPLIPGTPAPRPFGIVDHFRVLDKESGNDPFDLYDALRRIDEVLSRRQHEFVNLSIGPSMPVEDDEVHPWTALLDEHLSDGHALTTIAIGNTGEKDWDSGEARVQVPADCVNALAIGASDSTRSGWDRAGYSSIGPGRSPGRIKPDLVHFGGSATEPFHVYDATAAPGVATTIGTSFASPAALRLAAGVRAHFGGRLTPVALMALLVHAADDGDHDRREVGWGRIPSDIESMVVCTDGMVRVVYQGELSPSQYLRARVPLPAQSLAGMVTVEATLCYATRTDPQDPGAYSRSGLDVTFRPHSQKFASDDATVPRSHPFFRRGDCDDEDTLRNDAHKWETTIHAGTRMRSSSLFQPVFDIHYNARSAGGAARSADKIRYALVLTVRSPRTPDLYDGVVQAYAGVLETLTPIIGIPIRV